ncbi:MAG: hypothetical protein HY553_05660 [Elusimicrobia bacterium]|nr:hypothetical protein [Elusimicrobiota bacterium]
MSRLRGSPQLCAVFWLAAVAGALAASTGPRSQDSPAALAFTKSPLLTWWEALSGDERAAFLAKTPLLVLSLDTHRKLLRATKSETAIAERALKDWWDGQNQLQQQALLRAQPRLRDAWVAWRKSVDAWSARERGGAKAKASVR